MPEGETGYYKFEIDQDLPEKEKTEAEPPMTPHRYFEKDAESMEKMKNPASKHDTFGMSKLC